ncbi:TonB-dependent receptor [Sphingobium phenoxybenzoativorans]|uniref:TonB-dependent receptor n=1 Tax=Sphingobium phenoxybenzoativorans TaxID=1592790 RepID=UPI0008726EA6|nr:TonB-dependent receptor [Sphingobium phenoxybenzoativorans]
MQSNRNLWKCGNIIFAALMTSTALGGAAFAQDAAPQQAAADDVTSGDIIVTAQRREQRLGDVPLSVQAQTGEALTKAGITDSRALEQVSPALNFTAGYSPTTTSLVIRGAASLANEGGIQPSVGVVIDGVPVARQGEFIADLADIDRIEVLSGPQGTLFGKNSTAGVVNIISARPKHEFGVNVELTGTSDEEVIAKGTINAPVSDMAALRVTGYYHYLDPMVQNLAGPDLHGQRSYGGQAKLLLDFSDTVNLLLSGSYNKSYSTFGNNFVITPNSPPLSDFQRAVFGPIGWGVDVANQDTVSYSKNKLYSLVGELNADLTDELHLVSITGYRNSNNRVEIDVDTGPVGINPGRGFSPNPLGYPIQYVATEDEHQVEIYKYFSQEVRLAYSGNGLDIVAGAYYQNYNETRQLLLPFIFDGAFVLQDPTLAGVPFYVSDTLHSALSDDTIAVFGDVTYAITPTINVFGGLRYTNEKLQLDYYHDAFFNPAAGFFDPITVTNSAPPISNITFRSKRTDNNLSGRIGVQWKPAPGLNYYASYNRGYKGPAANQGRAANNAATALLDPEIADAFEIGAKQRLFDGLLTFDIALYKQKIKNIQQSSITGGVTVDLINAGALKIKGFESNLTLRPVDGLSLNAGIVYNDAYYSGDNIFFTCGPTITAECPNGAAGVQNLNGKQAIGSPKWKVVSSAAYDVPVNESLKVSLRVAYNWRSSIQYQLQQDPLTRHPSYGILDASIGVGDLNDRWSLTLFGKNLTDKFYYSNLNTADFFIGQQFGNFGRDYRRYGGLRLTYKM